MSCLITRNSEGRIVEVTTPSGQQSELFKAIHSNIFMADAETSVKILMNAYSPEIEQMYFDNPEYTYSTGEPQIFYLSSVNKEYDNLEDLILNDDLGETLMGFKNPVSGNFIPIVKFDTSSSEKSKFFADSIRQGVLSAERVIDSNGVTRLQGKGEFPETRLVTARLFWFNSVVDYGEGKAHVNSDGTIDWPIDNSYILAEHENGKDVIRIENGLEAIKQKEYTNKLEIIMNYFGIYENPRPLEKQDPVRKVATRSLEVTLNNFLEALGFQKTTLEEYRKNYNTRYGEDPDIQALADIANKVVAFQEGVMRIEDLSEEVAHIAIESYNDQNSIAGLVSNVHLTPEYHEFSEYYRNKYSDFYSGVDLEEQVRKEVLGKILAKEFSTRFSEKNKTAEQLNISQKLKNIWDQFIQYVSSFFKPQHRLVLNKINSQIAQSISEGRIEDFQNPLVSGNFYYSAMSKDGQNIEQTLRASKKVVEDLFTRVLSQSAPSQTELGRISDKMSVLNILSSVNTIVSITSNQLSVLETNVREASAKGVLISQVDDGRYRVLNDNLIPLITRIKSQMNQLRTTDPNDKKVIENLSSSIDEMIIRKSNIDPLLNADKEGYVRRMMDKALSSAVMTSDEKEAEISKLEGNVRDLSWFGKLFGLVTHSVNPLIQLLGRKVIDMGTNVVRNFKARADQEIDLIYGKGLQKHQRNLIKKDEKGQRTHYFISPINWAKYFSDLAKKENEIIASLTGKKIEDITRLRKKFSPSDIIGDESVFKEYSDTVKKWKNEEATERRFTKEYYDQRDARFNKVNASQYTREYLSQVNISEFNLLKPYVNANGTIDRSRLTEAERIQIINLRKTKEADKSAYDQFGNLKEGLMRIKPSELSPEELSSLPFTVDPSFIGEITVLQPGYSLEDLSESARLSLDLSNLNMLYREEMQNKERSAKPIKAFSDQIKELEDRGEVAYDWVMSNATITFTDDYFENIGVVAGFDEIAQEYIYSLEDTQEASLKQDVLNEYRELQRARKDLLRQNRMINNPIETDVINMMGTVKERIIQLDSIIDEKRRALNIPSEFFESQENTGSKGVNQAFEKLRIQSGLSEFDFALKHMTERNFVRVNDFALNVSDLVKGKRQYTKKAYEDFLKESIASGLVKSGMSSEEIVTILKNEYAKKYVASYFQRYEPEGYTQVMDSLQDGTIKLSEIIENREGMISEFPGLRYIQITPDYTWTEDVNNAEFMNKNFKPSGYYLRPRLDKYLDDEFFSRYGIKKEDYMNLDNEDISKLVPTKNNDEYQLLLRLIGLRETVLENYGISDTVNKYQLVQLSSGTFEKFARISNITRQGNIKDSIKDVFYNRKDEKIYGEQLDDDNLMELGSEISVKIIPKYYQSKLEDAGAITESLIEAGLMDLKQSLIYKERKAVERDMKTLEWKISQQRFLNNGGIDKKNRILKRGEVSNYYEKAVEYVNHHLYGIQQTRHFETTIMGRTIDISRVVNWIQGKVRFTNLGFNAFVDLTSATTGILSNVTDRLVGDFYHPSSANRANSQMTSMMAGYIAEAGKTQKNTRMNTLLEFFKVEDVDSRIKNSAFSRGMRLIQKSPYLLSKLSNMPVTPKILLTILNDLRYSDGSFRSYNEFTIYHRNIDKSITKAEIDSKWNAIKNDSLYDNLDITSRSVKPNQKFKSKFSNSSEVFDQIHSDVIAKARQVIQSADGVINEVDQVAAQRDMLTNLFMMHRGWLLINLTKRFKKKHYNLSTGQVEEGHYVTLFRTLAESVKTFRDKKSVKDYWKTLSPYERRNLRRFGIDTTFMALILALGELILAADDDDDTALENLAQLIYLRTTSEHNSAQILGIPGSIIETAKSPIVALSTLGSLEPLSLFQSIGDEDSEGNSKFIQKVMKATIAKRYNQFSDLQKQIDSFRHFNDPTLFNLGEEKKEE